jgi:O-antigen ligase
MFTTAEGLSHGGLGKWSASHNAYLQVGTELGLPGLVCFLGILWRGFAATRAARRRASLEPGPRRKELMLASGLELSLCAYAITAMSLSIADSPVLYLLIALSTALFTTIRQGAAIRPSRQIAMSASSRPVTQGVE